MVVLTGWHDNSSFVYALSTDIRLVYGVSFKQHVSEE